MSTPTTPAPTITIGDEVIYPADNPRSGFLARVILIEPDGMALCQPVHGTEPFKCKLSDLRLYNTEGS